ncbi:unnamed protein product, partial [Brenthis ino]
MIRGRASIVVTRRLGHGARHKHHPRDASRLCKLYRSVAWRRAAGGGGGAGEGRYTHTYTPCSTYPLLTLLF